MEWLAGALPFLFVLACPIGMFFMMRMMGGGGNSNSGAAPDRGAAPGRTDPGERLALLELRQGELGRQIAAARPAAEQDTVSKPH